MQVHRIKRRGAFQMHHVACQGGGRRYPGLTFDPLRNPLIPFLAFERTNIKAVKDKKIRFGVSSLVQGSIRFGISVLTQNAVLERSLGFIELEVSGPTTEAALENGEESKENTNDTSRA